MYNLGFIRQIDFEKHVKEILEAYNQTLHNISLDEFNKNKIDPIKLLFDKEVYRKNYEDLISFELSRQRDKTNTNHIGYFHQNIFKYFKNCEVPKQGFDVVFTAKNGLKYYIELKK